MTETRTTVLLAAALTLLSGHGLADDSGKVEELYVKSCAVCHAAGAAGAPKTGDAAQWEPRLAKGMDVLVANVQQGLNAMPPKGMDVLVANVQQGLNAMPPKGMCFDCSPENYKALIEYMAKAQ